MNKDRILRNSLNIIKKYLNENGVIPSSSGGNTLSSGAIAGTEYYKGTPESKLPPVDLNKRKKPPMFRRKTSVQTGQSS